MGLSQDGGASEIQDDEIVGLDVGTLSLDAFSNLIHISPVSFLYLLKESYCYGQCKASKKFQALLSQVYKVLQNNPQPGPATFVAQCLLLLPVFGDYSGGFSHMIISAFRRFLKSDTTMKGQRDTMKARKLVAMLFLDNVGGSVGYDEKILVKILEVFDVGLVDIDEALCQVKPQKGCGFENAKAFIEHYISSLIESRSFTAVVSLSEHFAIRLHDKSLLQKMAHDKAYTAAERWATFMGRPSLCALVREYGERNLLKNALTIISKYNLQNDFPELYRRCRESSLKNLVEKACWDVAEAKANGNRQLLDYLVYLAIEAGYREKVEELCERYSLQDFVKAKEAETGILQKQFLHLDDLAIEDVLWVDEVDDLRTAACYLEGCRVLGIDCEWKPNYVKGGKPNKVSIMQIASDGKVFILDLIKLSKEAPVFLDNCLCQILQSSRILKLGYNFQADISQLAQSYGDLRCFKHYDVLLDLQGALKVQCGGLLDLRRCNILASVLFSLPTNKKVLGVGLNKMRRNSDWEQRPLSQHQLEYAALDAAVLIHIFSHIGDQTQAQSTSRVVENSK